MSEAVEENIYNWTPSIYQRRDAFDRGLGSTENMRADIVSDGVLEVSNQTPLNDAYGINRSGKTLTEIVLSGSGYMYPVPEITRPRDFVGATKEKLQQNGVHKRALLEGLKNRGLDVK